MSDASGISIGEEGKDGVDYGKCPGFAKCKGEYRNRGCDGTGKIQGGIATYPFFGWWPIKVFRPCPSFQDAGYVYRREGQTLDQVLFSEPSTKMQEKMAAMREEERQAKRDESEATATAAAPESSSSPPKDDLSSEEEKFLEDKFGKN